MAESAPSDFFRRVWAVVAQVPRGRVTTYGHIARHIGMGSPGWPSAGRSKLSPPPTTRSRCRATAS
ncbi:MAG: MGMT family protein [Bacteroidota bacterium]